MEGLNKEYLDYCKTQSITPCLEFLGENEIKIPYGNMNPSEYTAMALWRRLPLGFRRMKGLNKISLIHFHFYKNGFAHLKFKI